MLLAFHPHDVLAHRREGGHLVHLPEVEGLLHAEAFEHVVVPGEQEGRLAVKVDRVRRGAVSQVGDDLVEVGDLAVSGGRHEREIEQR